MKKLILLLFALFIFKGSSFASHIWGADITYTCLGGGNYIITYDFYRDCVGVPAPTSVFLNLSNTCGFVDTMYLITPVLLGEIYQHCTQPSTCNGGNLLGIEKWRYQDTIFLPDTCAIWNVSVTLCCRDAALMSVIGGSSYQIYSEATINNTVDCDTSTTFMNNLVVEVCKNQPVCIDPGFFDTEGDSIVATFTTPRVGLNTPIVYDSGYSVLYPMILNAPLTIDPTTGRFCFTPLANDYSVYAIEVAMYRQGRFLGKILRDVNIIVVNCAPGQPSLSGFNGGLSTDTFVCENQLLCFDLLTIPHDLSDSTFISWDSGIPTASFTPNAGQNKSAQFCWTPTHADASTLPYCFSVNVKDNSCLAAESDIKTYCITVYDSIGCLTANVKDPSTQSTFEIFPQPATDNIRIKLDNNYQSHISISDLLGKIVFENDFTPVNNEINISSLNLPSGNYLLSVRNMSNNIVSTKKIIIDKKY